MTEAFPVFEVPAVVGTKDATRNPRDGQLVELDGTVGIIRLC